MTAICSVTQMNCHSNMLSLRYPFSNTAVISNHRSANHMKLLASEVLVTMLHTGPWRPVFPWITGKFPILQIRWWHGSYEQRILAILNIAIQPITYFLSLSTIKRFKPCGPVDIIVYSQPNAHYRIYVTAPSHNIFSLEILVSISRTRSHCMSIYLRPLVMRFNLFYSHNKRSVCLHALKSRSAGLYTCFSSDFESYTLFWKMRIVALERIWDSQRWSVTEYYSFGVLTKSEIFKLEMIHPQ